MATIYDVAKTAGVSPKTVSRVLNGDAPVGAATRNAVEKAIAHLGYVPNNAARMMRSNRSGLIGLITGALSQNLEPMEPAGLPSLYIVQGIQNIFADSGKTLMIADTGGHSIKVPALVRTFLQHRVEALIYVADYHSEVKLDVAGASCPVVLVNCFDKKHTPSIVPDDEQGQFELVSGLIQSGHSRIAYLTLDKHMVASRLRSAGYRRALEAASIPLDPALELNAKKDVDDDSGELLQGALLSLLRLDQPPSVICCGNDEMALRVYGLIRSQGLRIPEDISVAGYDNYRVIAETLYPPLTTVELPYFRMGTEAARRALDLIDNIHSATRGSQIVSGPVHWRSSVISLNRVTNLNTIRRRTSQ